MVPRSDTPALSLDMDSCNGAPLLRGLEAIPAAERGYGGVPNRAAQTGLPESHQIQGSLQPGARRCSFVLRGLISDGRRTSRQVTV